MKRFSLTVLLSCIFLGHPVLASEKVFNVPNGAPVQKVAQTLQQEGYIRSSWIFRLWEKVDNRLGAIKPGLYEIPPGKTTREVLHLLQKGPSAMRLTLPEGWTARQMAEALEQKGVTPAREFMALVTAQKLEGYLFPDTYLFHPKTSPTEVIAKLTARFNQMKPEDFEDRARAMRLTTQQLVTLASIVEREARVPEERPMIAGVFFNRLKKGWRLESCATVQYAQGSWKPVLSFKDLEIVSPYNTYRHGGLPPGPISNPGAEALWAAAHPAEHDLMFFVADGQGTHRFTRYFGDHIKAKEQKKKHR